MKLKNFQKFENASAALEEVASLIEGKVTPRLASLLESIKDEKKVSLAVADPKLGMAPTSGYNIIFAGNLQGR
jgi:nucleolar protein 58